jgi:hypothetical protein
VRKAKAKQFLYDRLRVIHPLQFLIGTIVCLILVLPSNLAASLGGDYSTVEADRAKMQATLHTTSKESYQVHELQAPGGVAVREYVSSAGNVFGIAWNGPAPPNLPQLLGSYYSQYLAAVKEQQAKRRGHGPVFVQLPGLIVQAGGRARAFVGRAYVPQTLPNGVRAQDIQ